MKQKLAKSQAASIELPCFVSFDDQRIEPGLGKAGSMAIVHTEKPRNLPGHIRRRLASFASEDLAEALLRGLAWGNGRGIR